MHAGKHIEARFPSTVAGSTRGEGLRALPPDLLRDASHRLAIACFIFSGLLAMALALNLVILPAIGYQAQGAWPLPGAWLVTAALIMSLGLAFYALRRERDPHRALDIALVYEVVLAAVVATLDYVTYRPYAERPPLNFVGIIILIFALIVPNTPRKTLIASLVAATMIPLGMMASVLRGNPAPTATEAVLLNLFSYIFAFVAAVPAHIITRLGRQVTKARELGSYRLETLLGKGGMGEVWKAQHRMLARPAAIKLIRPEVLGSGEAESAKMTLHRFEREAQATAALRSPHSIELYDFGINDEGVFYYVMELLEGFDLETLVKRFGPVEPARAVHILKQACWSLAEAHHKSMVHRDVKPANIFICNLGLELDFVKVLDFGLVKAETGTLAGDAMMTADHAAGGTPAYMAPETLTGGAVDARVDIYALGCVGYWLLTGQLVFEADTALNVAIKHVHEAPVPPSRRSELEVPAALDALILSCLEKKPEARPRSAGELSQRLAAADSGAPWTRERMERWWETHHLRARTETDDADPQLLQTLPV